MAKGDEENKSSEDLEYEQGVSERAKISLPEIIIVVMISISSELLEWLGDLANLLPVLGQAIWFFTFGAGVVVSMGLLLWSFIRGMYNGKKTVLKLAFMVGGPVLDFFTAGLFPETLTLVAAIMLHNHLEGKNINRLAGILEKTK